MVENSASLKQDNLYIKDLGNTPFEIILFSLKIKRQTGFLGVSKAFEHNSLKQ